jgi:magnesium transporter
MVESSMTSATAASAVSSNDLLGTAVRQATRDVPVAAPVDLVDAVLTEMRGRRYDSAGVVAVCVDDRLVGLATIERLLAAAPATAIGEVMDSAPPVVGPHTDQEHAAWQAIQHGEPGLAVVDDAGHFVGLIPPQRLMEVLLEEHDEDLARLGGYLRVTESARVASVESVPRRLWHRLPWLAVGLAGAMVAASVMAAFEVQLEANLLVAYFVPGIVYLADAVGTQTEALAIRGLSVGVGIRRVATREVLTGLLVGLLLGVFMFLAIVLLWGDPAVASAVAIAVAAASTIATGVALALPWLLHRLGRDPAFGSGPLATVIQDLLSILIYFTTAAALLS